jgi:hypothetical protein
MLAGDPFVVRLCLTILRAIRPLVPRTAREDWMREWEGENRHPWDSFIGRDCHHWTDGADLVRRTSGALSDAAWLRRRSTWDLDVMQDIRHGLRLLRTRPFLSSMAVAILALGVGSTVAIFSFVDRLILRDPPYRDPIGWSRCGRRAPTHPTAGRAHRPAPSSRGGSAPRR